MLTTMRLIYFILLLGAEGAACGFVYMSNYSIAPNHIEISFKPETYENYPCYVDYARCDDFYHNTNCSVTRSNDFDCNQNVSLENLRNGTQYYFQISFSNLVTGINYYFSNCFTTGEEVELANGILYTVTATNISINRPQFNDGNVYIEILNSGEFGAISYWYWPDLVVYNLTAATSYDFIFGFFYTLYWSFCYIGSAKFSTACT
ncbi:uncharacterized protein LOC142356607, partial [Convolutriloba macropyga]|uniref:uncharacterized protein LOC142356607 n=1 Tax=Convolutriloba macropyga TaxID=536237 RepID=UPI003F51BEE1